MIENIKNEQLTLQDVYEEISWTLYHAYEYMQYNIKQSKKGEVIISENNIKELCEHLTNTFNAQLRTATPMQVQLTLTNMNQ